MPGRLRRTPLASPSKSETATIESAVDGSRARRLRLLPVWALFSCVLAALAIVWSLSTPIPSGPDEPTHYVKAAAVDRGTLTGRVPPGTKPGTADVRVPGTIDFLRGSGNCYYNKPQTPAGCAHGTAPASRDVESSTYVAFYPPLYYAIVGLPSLVSTSTWGLRVMRMVSAFLDALFLGLALALVAVFSRSRWMATGTLLAITPMALYLMSVLNSSGLEVAAAAAAWVALVLLFFDYSRAPPRRLLAAFCVSALFLAFSRPFSVAYLAAMVGLLVLLRPAAAKRLVGQRRVQFALAPTLVGSIAALVYVLVERSYRMEHFAAPPGANQAHLVAGAVGRIPIVIEQLVGGFGGPDFNAPAFAVAIWVIGCGALVGLALFLAGRWEAAVLGACAVLILVALPVLVQLAASRSYVALWQGRYTYPLAFGIPIVAAALLSDRGINPRRGPGLAAAATASGMVVTYFWVARRYSVGLGSALNPFQRVPDHWTPLISFTPLLVLVTVLTGGCVALAWWFARSHESLPASASAFDPGSLTHRSGVLPAEESATSPEASTGPAASWSS